MRGGKFSDWVGLYWIVYWLLGRIGTSGRERKENGFVYTFLFLRWVRLKWGLAVVDIVADHTYW